MQPKKSSAAQISVEYLMITAFMLVIIVIIFATALLTTDQNIKTRQISENLDNIIQTADLVYAMGSGNVLFTEVYWPNEISGVTIWYKCKTNVAMAGCDGADKESPAMCNCNAGGACLSGNDCIDRSAVKVVTTMFSNAFVYTSKARIVITPTSTCSDGSTVNFLTTNIKYEIKVSGTETGIVELKRYCD